MYKLSVIVPVYNTISFLNECVDSIKQQTLRNIEIILVDDESPDGAGELCDRFSRENTDIKVIHKKNGGLGYARNSGLELAEGEYVAFLDSDDYVEPQYYKQMIEKADEYAADICVSKGFFKCSDKKEEFVYSTDSCVVEGDEIKALIPRLISQKPGKNDGLWGSVCFSIYRRDVIKDLRFISERGFISEDLWFSMDAYSVSRKIILSDIIGYCYRYNEASLSRGYRKNRFEQLVSTAEQLKAKCLKMKLEDYEERIALYYWVNYEKCINQEVRYKKKNAIQNIKGMNENPISRDVVKRLATTKYPDGFHHLLCKLLYRKQYVQIVLLLKVYNMIKH